MTQDQAVHLYLNEVLGIKSILKPVMEEEPQSPKTDQIRYEIVGPSPALLLWVPTAPASEVRALLDRMMAAAKISEYLIFWGSASEELPSGVQLRAGLRFFGEGPRDSEVEFAGVSLLSTITLESMLVGEASQIQQNKRWVWGQIQELVALLNTSK